MDSHVIYSFNQIAKYSSNVETDVPMTPRVSLLSQQMAAPNVGPINAEHNPHAPIQAQNPVEYQPDNSTARPRNFTPSTPIRIPKRKHARRE
jgi:hypothetical protein